MASRIKWDDKALRRAVADAARSKVESVTARIGASANGMGAAFQTGYYHRDHKSPAVGGTTASYTAEVTDFSGWPVGIVHTGNYAAMRDNHENNTLLKAMG